MNRRPNVLLLSIDALRADRTGLHGYHRPTTPNLDRLGERSLVCTETVANAAFSQPSMASLMTSSMPLSHGGYDFGAEGRPPTVFKAFREAGHHTILLSTYIAVSRLYGYRGDADEDACLFVIGTLTGNILVSIRNTVAAFEEGLIGKAEMMAAVVPVLAKGFDNITEYCAIRRRDRRRDRADFPTSRLVNDGYDFARIEALVAGHRREFEADPGDYVLGHMVPLPDPQEWLAGEWNYMRRPATYISEAAFRLGNGLLGLADRRRARLRSYRHKSYLDGSQLADRVIRHLEERSRDPEKPFFLWTHFFDTHTPYCPGRGKAWHEEARRILDGLGYDSGIDAATALGGMPETAEQWHDWSAMFDATVAYTDRQVGRILDALDRLGLGDNTIVAVCGDHGEELGEHGNISHHFLPYEHNIRVPMLFSGPGVGPGRCDALTSLLDLVPSIAEMAGIEADSAWVGTPVTDPAVNERRHQIVECFHSGNCLFEHRPLYFGLRTRSHKYFWKEYKDPSDRFSRDGNELYDLTADPGEKVNLYRPDHPVVDELNPVIAARMAEIAEIPQVRIDAAFPELTPAARSA